jgi:glycosyltransferase involved in cell wall biosynthesis
VCYDAARVRILLDYRPALRQRTGVGHYVHELASALQPLLAAEDSLVLFSSSWKDRVGRRPVPGAAVVDRRIPVSALNLAWHRLEWPPVEWLAGAADIAHSTHPLLMPARRAARVLTIYDLDFLDHPERTRAEIRRDYPALAARHARRADLVVVISDYTARQVEARLGVRPERLAVCRPGAPAWPPREGPPSAAGPILFVGTIEPRKNLETLFAAYARVAAGRSATPALVLAGRSVEQSAGILERLTQAEALAGRVRAIGYVTDEERQRLYRDASMLVLPSLEEGFGMTAVEAMHSGTPVVVSNRGALPEVVGEAGILVDAADVEGFAGAIASLLDDEQKRRAYAEAGRRRARAFSWRASAEHLLAAYRAVLARRRPDRTAMAAC